MAKYRFLVMTNMHKKSVYEVEAMTVDDAVNKAKQQGYFVIKRLSSGSSYFSLSRWQFNKQKEVLLFIKKLGLLLSSSLPLSDSLLFLAKNNQKTFFKKIILSLYVKISEGKTLSDAMHDYPQFFFGTTCAVVLAGEKSGHMDEALAHLTQYLENREELNSSVRQAIAYPALLVVVSITIIILLMAIAIPAIAEQLGQSNIPLPMSTRLVIAMSHFINFYWHWMLLGCFFLMLIFNWLMKKKKIRLWVHKMLLSIPIVGVLIKKTQTTSVLMTLGILTKFSVPLLDAFRVSKGVINNLWLKKQLEDAYANINEGSTIYHALVNAHILDETSLALLSAGERSGDFHEMVNYATQISQKEIKNTLSTLIKLLEPTLIFFVGFIVLFIFMSVMQPMLSLNNMVQ